MILKTDKVIKEYTDYNGHLNVAYYVRIFDIAADVMLDNFNMGGESAKQNSKTTFVAEMHLTPQAKEEALEFVDVPFSLINAIVSVVYGTSAMTDCSCSSHALPGTDFCCSIHHG